MNFEDEHQVRTAIMEKMMRLQAGDLEEGEALEMLDEIVGFLCAHVTSHWDDDSPDAIMARGMVSSIRFLIEGMRQGFIKSNEIGQRVNPEMMALGMHCYNALSTAMVHLIKMKRGNGNP